MTKFRLSMLAWSLITDHNLPVINLHTGRPADPMDTIADGPDVDLAVQVPATSWSDYHGDDYQRANHIALQADFPGVFHDQTSRWEEGGTLYVSLEVVDDDTTHEVHKSLESGRELADRLIGLRDEYPLWDEGTHDALIEQLIGETWDAWMGMDVYSVVHADARTADPDGPAEFAADMANVDDLKDAFWSTYSTMVDAEGQEYPYAENATSVVIPDWERAAHKLAAKFVSDWSASQAS